MESNIINKFSKFSKFSIPSKNIRFNHSSYGIIKNGYYKGLEIEIREYIPEKLEVKIDNKIILTTRNNLKGKEYTIKNIVPARIRGTLNNLKEIVLNANSVFYRDVLFKNKNDNISYYASIKKITKRGSEDDYYINGEIFKDKKYTDIRFRKSDIIEYMNNFKINESDPTDQRGETDTYLTDVENTGLARYSEFETEPTEPTEETDTYSESGEFDYYPEIEDETEDETEEEKEDEKDFDRPIPKVTSDGNIISKNIEHILLSLKYKCDINIIKKNFSKQNDRITEINNMGIISTDVLNIINEINETTKYMNVLLKSKNRNIAVNSIDHLFIISSVVFLHLNNVNYVNYVNCLIKSEYFGKGVNGVKKNLNNCIVLRNDSIFECKINKDDLKDLNKLVKNIHSCFIKIIEPRLKLKETSRTFASEESASEESASEESASEEGNLSGIEFIKPKSSSQKRKRSEPDTSTSTSTSTVYDIKNQLINKRNNTNNENKIILYDYLIKNIDKVDEGLNELRPIVISILTKIFKDNFKDNYEICGDLGCKERVLSNYIQKTFDKIIETRGEIDIVTQNDNLTLQKYIELNKLRIIENRERLNPTGQGTIGLNLISESNNRDSRLKRFNEMIKKAQSKKSKSKSKESKPRYGPCPVPECKKYFSNKNDYLEHLDQEREKINMEDYIVKPTPSFDSPSQLGSYPTETEEDKDLARRYADRYPDSQQSINIDDSNMISYLLKDIKLK